MIQVINRFIRQARSEQGLSEATLKGYRDDLRKFATYVRESYGSKILPGDVTPVMIHDFLEFLGQHGYRGRNGPASRAKRLASIRAFFKFLHREELIGRDPAADIHAPRIRYNEPDYLQPHEYAALLKAAQQNTNPFLALRNKALLSMLLGTGARVSELVHIDVKHVDLKGHRIRLHRKGGEMQGLPLSEELVGILRPYLKQRRSRTHCRAVFISIRGRRLTQQAVWKVVHDCAAQARITTKKISPHTLRHSFATTLLSNGENLQTIRILMNHKNLSTTARYLHTKDEQLSAAVNGISLS